MKIVVFCLLFIIAGSQAQEVSINLMLRNVTVLAGERAVIPCNYEATGVEGLIPTLKWWAVAESGDRQRLYVFKEDDETVTGQSAGVDRVFGIQSDGSLIIPNATLADNAPYGNLVCQLDFGQPGEEEGKLTFSVVKTADKEAVAEIQPGTQFQVGTTPVTIGTCKTGNAYPTPVISFYRGTEEIQSDEGTKSIAENINNAFGDFTDGTVTTKTTEGTSSVKRTLVLPLSKEDDMAKFYCIVTSGGGDGPPTKLIQNVTFAAFRVEYPTDTVTLTSNKDLAFVGDTIQLTCEANGYPEPNIRLDGNEGSTTIDITVTKDDQDREVVCRASNAQDIQPVNDTYTINALYADKPTISGESTIVYGGDINLSCESMSNPPRSDIMWKMGGEVISREANLVISEAMFKHAGTYMCVVQNVHSNLNREASFEVMVNGLNADSTEDEMVEGKINDVVDLVCEAQSSPKPMFKWTKISDGSTVEGMDADVGNSMYSSTITVGPLDSGMSNTEYTCTISNGVSADVTKTYVLPEMEETSTVKVDKLPLASTKTNEKKTIVEEPSSPPTAGIIIGVLVALLVVAIIIAVLYNKGIICKKAEKGEENADDDIAVELNKEEAPADANADVEAGKPEAEADIATEEDARLVNGSGEQ